MESKHHSTGQVAFGADSLSSLFSAASRQDKTKNNMYEAFQTWALKTYGDDTKTKTVTRRKYNCIFKILNSDKDISTINPKFEHWVKSKGFQIGSPHGHKVTTNKQVLHVPSSKVLANGKMSSVKIVYKEVAVVEDFYEIIYETYAKMNGICGIKKTYKAITEKYCFLPREAVSHFLMLYTGYQKQMFLRANQSGISFSCHASIHDENTSLLNTVSDNNSLHFDYNLPLSIVYRKYIHSLDYSENDNLPTNEENFEHNREANFSQYLLTDIQNHDFKVTKENKRNSLITTDLYHTEIKYAKFNTSQGFMSKEPLNIVKESSIHIKHSPSHQKWTSSCNGYLQIKDSTISSDLFVNSENKDNKEIGIDMYDPNRFEAFKMFVCLFVDENLDCMIPISHQPKNKIHAIIDCCSRQFPEFKNRTGKQIQIYLNSCKQNKRIENGSICKLRRNMQWHLTPVVEDILATACKNESENVRRMHLSLEPIPTNINQSRTKIISQESYEEKSTTSSLVNQAQNSLLPSNLLTSSMPNRHTNSDVRVNNGSIGLNMQKEVCSESSVSKRFLNPDVVISVKQLITDYRNSAALLLKSADELEQVLLHQS